MADNSNRPAEPRIHVEPPRPSREQRQLDQFFREGATEMQASLVEHPGESGVVWEKYEPLGVDPTKFEAAQAQAEVFGESSGAAWVSEDREQKIRWPDPPVKEALHGLAGDMMRAIEPHPEADPAVADYAGPPSGDVGANFGPEPDCKAKLYPRYQPGIYEAECLGAAVYRDRGFRRWTARLEFGILPGAVETVYGFLNLGKGEEPAFGRRSKYFRAWVIANGDAPRRRQRLSHHVFKGKCFQVRIDDTIKDYSGRAHPTGAVYSTVKDIIRRTYP